MGNLERGGIVSKTKKTIALEDSVIAKVQQFADENGITFTGAISVLVGNALTAYKSLDSVKELTAMIEWAKTQQNELDARRQQ